MPVIIL